ncbi:MAG: alpha-2-macroglobulin family protein [Hyphomicrobiaceae bacterium]
MQFIIRVLTLLTCIVSIASIGIANAQTNKQLDEPAHKIFKHSGIEGDAARYEAYLKKNWKPQRQQAENLIAEGVVNLANDARLASRQFAGAVVVNPKSAPAWIGLAEALLLIQPDPNKGSERYDLPVNASAAAYRGYQMASDDTTKAQALKFLGQALERRSYWRPAIEALKTSLFLAEDQTTRSLLKRLRGTHGFRMVDYKTDAEASPPRICMQFSETLTAPPTDHAKFIAVNGRDPQSVRAEGKQLCVDGLTHGQRYQVQIRAGLPAKIGEKLLKTAEISVYLPDRKASARFTGRNYVLPSRGQQGIPVVSVNTQKLDIEVYRVGDRSLAQTLQSGDLQRQMSSWNLDALKNRSGERVYKGQMDVKSKLNKDVTTAFPVSEAIGTLKPGVYVMSARAAVAAGNNNNQLASQWFVVSDLGLTAFSGDDGVHTFVRSLATTSPIANAKVRLVARNNEVLGTQTTDERGYVKFSSGLARGEGGLQPAMIVAQNDPGGYAFLDLTTSAFDLSDRGVKGRKAPGPVDSFLYTERGVYRPGEDVHLTALVRDAKANAISLPVTMIVTRPDGVEFRRMVLEDEGLGGRSTTLALAKTAMTGTWRARIHTDPEASALTDISFLVEDFVPERLDMTLKPQADAIKVGEGVVVDAVGRFLYGPPAAGLAIEGDVIVKPASGLDGYKDFQFGLANEYVTPVRESLQTLPRTGANGKASISVRLPAIPKTAKPLRADVLIRLRESGGRTIERRISLPVATGQRRIGIRPLFDGGTVGEGEAAKFELVHLNAKDKPSNVKGLDWTLYRLDTTWQWYNQNGRWSYEAVSMTRKVANGRIDAQASGPVQLAMPVSYGRYQLEVTAPGINAPATTTLFNSGWYVSGDKADSPEVLDVALDKKSYNIGDIAKLRIASKRGGTALVSVLGDDLKMIKEVRVAAGLQEIDLQVGSDWGAGAYITAILYRPMDETAKRMPSRSLGVTWLSLDEKPRTLDVALNVAEKVRATDGLKVPVKILGLKAGEDARVTIAAVDVGILNLTGYKTPAPEKWFYGQRRLNHEIRDFYGRLIDGMHAIRGTLRSGGDGGAGLQMQGSPPIDETVALFSGLVEVNADGTAEVEFALPNFNGSVRLTAVAWSSDKLGHAQKDIIVRDAIALTASAPRILTLGDRADFTLDLHNVEGVSDTYRLVVNEQAERQTLATLIERDVELDKGERKTQRLTIAPKRLGPHTYAMRVTGPGGVDVTRKIAINVQPPANDIKRTTVSSLDPGQSLTLSSDIATDLIAGRTSINLSVGRNARLDVPSLMTALDRYAYGCAEQTVSKALPLVYANALASQVGKVAKADIKKRVQKSIAHVFSMQDSTGAFGTWGPSNTNIWLTSYVADFLTRANEQGYSVPKRAFNQTLDRLANYISYAQDFKKGGEQRAYALYVLARNGRAPMGELRYYADTRLSRFSTPLAKAQIGAALAMMGDKARANRAFASAISDVEKKNGASIVLSRSDYGSRLRDGAALVALTAETGLATAAAPRLVDVIAKAAAARSYTSTQEQAWMLLAANALGKDSATALDINGQSHGGSLMRTLTPVELIDENVVVKNTGDTPVDAVISVLGASLTPEPGVAKGFEISRNFHTLDGKNVDLRKTTSIDQNQRFVAVVTVKTKNPGGRLLLVDRLPAGFEIENPRLVSSGDVKSINWVKTGVQPEHTEFRDDRFVAAFDLHNTRRRNNASAPETVLQVAYIVRAVTPGTFIHPAATVEDMYRPERYARTDMGQLTIKPAVAAK